ncbi:hypothetical protein H0H81_006209 [Sphagnurus paluster]|uniref:Uncharacterized protein n=1 Tax=Sphagnurus paluster TaxID=117069 RepID=A0A9P7GL87_9AGAR|nr:hypothetical protein H0H81_006209 [Sphagnurus paluster]
MRFITSASIAFALSASPLVASLGVENCGGANSDLTRSCYTCPVISYFNVGIFSWDTVSRICFGYLAGSSDTRMACTYYEAGYKWTDKWWGGSKERWQEPRLVGRCYYSEDGDLLTSGSYAGYSSSECPRKAVRENDSECAREKDKGTYYKCAQPECAYETAMCYGCPRLSSDFVTVSSSNDSLTCGYSSKGVVTNTCNFNGTDGRFLNSTSNSPRCPGTATVATACERSRQERLRVEAEKVAAAKKAAFIKSTYTDKGIIARDCAEFITEKAATRGYNYLPRYAGSHYDGPSLQLICDEPEEFGIVYGLALQNRYKEFTADLKAMVRTEYGTLFVLSAEAKIKLKNDLKACAKKLFDLYGGEGQTYQEPSDEEYEAYIARLPVLPQQCLRFSNSTDNPSPAS